MDSLPSLKPSDIQAFLSILEHVRDSGLLARFDIDVEARMHDVQDRIRQVSAHWFETLMQEKLKAPGVNRAFPLLLMTDEIEKSAKLLDKRFPEPLLGYVSRFLINSLNDLFTNTGSWILYLSSWKWLYHASLARYNSHRSDFLSHP